MLTWAIVCLLVGRDNIEGDVGCILFVAMVCDVIIFYFLFKFQPWK